MAAEKLNKFKSAAAKTAFETFLRNHVDNILTVAALKHYQLRPLTRYEKLSGYTAMQITPNTRYLDFHLEYSEDYAATQWRTKDFPELLHTLCHELAHIPMWEVEKGLNIENKQKTIDDHIERVVEHTSRWLYDSYMRFVDALNIDLETGLKEDK